MNIKINEAFFVLKLQGEDRDQLPKWVRLEYSSCIAESPQHQSHHDIRLNVMPNETMDEFAKRIVLAIQADATKKPEVEKTESEPETEG